MDSNENNEDKTLGTSTKMDVSDSSVQDKKSEKQSDKISSEKMVAKDNNNSENVDDTCVKINNTENETVDSQSTDSAKINTSQNDSKIIEAEKKKDVDKSTKVSNAVKDTESLEMNTSNMSITSTAVKDIKEGKRKRKSTISPPANANDSLVEQNGSSSSSNSSSSSTTTVSSTSTNSSSTSSGASASKRKKVEMKSDNFCWRCHKESVEAQCSACPRSWHRRCMGGAPPLSVTNWICGECAGILQAENAETRSPAMAQLTVDQLCMMLKHVVERMRDQSGSLPFWKAVDLNEVPNYLEYVVKPMDLSLLDSNVRAKMYGSTDAFMADARWIQHNCIVFNTYTSKLTNTAKQMLKVARQEVSEIEACPDCFAHGRNLPRPLPSWFIEPCSRPHPIVWAKLKGFPFWPAKAMPRLNAQGLVDVRFFGEHDRAWVSPKDIYLYSQEPPAALPRKKKLEMEQCVKEVEDHSKKLEVVFGEFRYAPAKVQYDPHDPMQIKLLLPNYDPSRNVRTDAAKADVQTTANNKVVPAKVDKKPQNSKSAVTASINGAIEIPAEKRKLVRKKRTADSPLQQPVNTESPEIETVAVIMNSKSKSPPVTPPVSNNNRSNSELSKSSSSPEVISTVLEVSNNISPKKNVLPIRKIKSSDNVKKLKLMKDIEKEEPKRFSPTVRSANGKVGVHTLPALNNLQKYANNIETVKSLTSVQKPKTVYVQSNLKRPTNLVPVNAKMIAKSPQTENKVVNKVLTKPVSKEMPKVPVVSPQRNSKDLSPNSNRPMTAIPVSAKKDQSKAMYLVMNSSASESARHFNEKETRLNSSVTVIKQEPKDDVQPKLTIARKPSKARKSFPNKPPNFPQQMMTSPTTMSTYAKSSSSATDAMVYIPCPSNDLRPTGPSSSSTPAAAATTATTSTSSASYELPPAEAGPATAQIHQNSKQLVNRVAQLIVDSIKDVAEGSATAAQGLAVNHHEAAVHYMKLRMERMRWEHQQEISELKHNNELVLRELKASMEVERYRALQDARREAEIERLRCIEETKRKQWCVVCGREAMFYCCWNTAYCDYPCQQKHWTSHIATCAQKGQSSQSQSSSRSSGSASTQVPIATATTPKSQQQNGNTCNEIQTLTTDSV